MANRRGARTDTSMMPGNKGPDHVYAQVFAVSLFVRYQANAHTVTNTARKHIHTRTNIRIVYEHMRSVFPPIEQASAFTFAGRISARSSILTLSWMTQIS